MTELEPTPRVSIGLPVYNGARFLTRALDSILGQDFKDFEVIIGDNASSDETGDICRDYADRDPRVRYYRNSVNVGSVANFNQTFDMARGPYFKWAAHDDYMDRSYLRRCVEALEERPEAVLSYTTMAIIDDEGEVIRIFRDLERLAPLASDRGNERFHTILWHLRDCHPVFGLFRSEALRRTGVIRNAVEPDRILLGEMSLLGPFLRISEPLFYRAVSPPRDGWRWLRPGNRRWLRLATPRMIYHHLSALLRSELNPLEKIWLSFDALAAIGIRRTRWKLRTLRRDWRGSRRVRDHASGRQP